MTALTATRGTGARHEHGVNASDADNIVYRLAGVGFCAAGASTYKSDQSLKTAAMPPLPPPSESDKKLDNAFDSQALDWFVRRGGGQGLDAADEALFQSWLRGDGARHQAYARWQHEWNGLDALPAAGIDALRRQLTADKEATKQAAAPTRRAWWRGLLELAPQAAPALVLLGACGAAWLGFQHWQRQPVYIGEFATGPGEQRDIKLPDGSQLRLDTATRAEVTLYRQRREVRLPEGQVLFQVRGDAQRPFEVIAGALRVTVVGTRFSVRHTDGIPGADGVRVAVEHGRVRVETIATSAQQARAALELGAGQQVAGDAAGHLGAVSAVNASGVAPWRDGRVNFDNAPLSQVLAEFGRYGSSGLSVSDPRTAALRLTGTFDPRRLDNFVRILPQVLPVHLENRDGGKEIVYRR